MNNKNTTKKTKKGRDIEALILVNKIRLPLTDIKVKLSLAIEGEYGEISSRMKSEIEKMLKDSEEVFRLLELFREIREEPKRNKIMFFEDDKFMEEVYQKKFTDNGLEVQSFNEPSDHFLEDIINFNPDLIITNGVMPKMSGMELLREIKKDSRTKKYPVLIFSSLGGDDLFKKESIESGAIDCWAKSDYSPKEVVEKIKDLLNK